jgi:hypothetical protein
MWGKFHTMLILCLEFCATEITALCHQAKTNNMFLPGGRLGPSPLTKMNRVEIFLMETLVLQIGFRLLPADAFSRMYLYWEHTVSENYFEIKYILFLLQMWFLETSSTTLEISVVLRQL